MNELIQLPTWAGSVPLWALLITVIVTLVKVWPTLKQLDQNSEAAIRKELRDRVFELKNDCRKCHEEAAQIKREAEEAVRKCREDCDIETRRLHDEILARDKQRIQEQISTITAMISAVGDNPQLKTLLKTFESVQAAQRFNVLQSRSETVIQDDDGA